MRIRISENQLYFLVFAVALGVRLLNLGAAPLNDSEAQWAMQALNSMRGASSIGAQPGYIMLTGLLFNLLPATNALARLLPALLGSMIVFLPAILRSAGERLPFPRPAAIILAFGLALDPTLSVLSRQVGSPMWAAGCLVLTIAALYARKPVVAGIFGGLALLGGPAVLYGALGLALTYGLIYLLEKSDWIAPLQETDELPTVEETAVKSDLRPWLYAVGITVLIAGTLFLAYPLGLSGLAASITSFFSGWSSISAISPLTSLAALVVYETLPLLFGLVCIGLAWLRRNGLGQRLSLWVLVTLVLGLLYPARQVGDLVWMLLPLWGLAAIAISNLIAIENEDRPLRWVALVQMLFLLILMIVLRLNLLAWQTTGTAISLVWLLMGGIVVMGTVATLMVGIGWSARLARAGAVWAIAVGGLLSMLAATFWGTQLPPTSRHELWTVIPAAGEINLLVESIERLSVSATGLNDQVEILSTVDSPSMHWALRNFKNARFAAQLAVTEQPGIVIAPADQTALESAASYRGQDFVWAEYPSWKGAIPDEWLTWLAFRRTPMIPYSVILWARSDLFPLQTSETP
jgi:hypothetical protein